MNICSPGMRNNIPWTYTCAFRNVCQLPWTKKKCSQERENNARQIVRYMNTYYRNRSLIQCLISMVLSKVDRHRKLPREQRFTLAILTAESSGRYGSRSSLPAITGARGKVASLCIAVDNRMGNRNPNPSVPCTPSFTNE